MMSSRWRRRREVEPLADSSDPLIEGLAPITSRVRTDVSAVRQPDGSSRWTTTAITREALARHLNGGPARGVCTIKAGESVTLVGLLDFDSHGGEVGWARMSEVVGRVCEVLELVHGMEPVLFRSSGGRGVHLMLLFDDPQDAYSVRQMLIDTLKLCGLKSGAGGVAKGEVEAFPKQNEVAIGGYGNQFILPLSNQSVPLVLRDVDNALW